MAKMIRTFIAVELPPEVRGRAARLQQSLAESGANVRWVERDNIHLTLKFLGEIEDVQVAAVCRVLQQVAAGSEPFELEVTGVGAFPNAERPRTLWVGIDGGADALIAMHGRLDAALAQLGYRPDERRFSPHVTIGRLRNSRDSRRLAAALAEKADWKAGAVSVDEAVVMASELTPQGARYTVMGRGPLGA
jgi:2'-5' RNA ligase